jgi:hypothetical protein
MKEQTATDPSHPNSWFRWVDRIPTKVNGDPQTLDAIFAQGLV